MGKESGIEWTDHTFNPWWGCVKVSPGCAKCYAESSSKRFGHEIWGPTAPRRFFGDKHWQQPVTWNEQAQMFYQCAGCGKREVRKWVRHGELDLGGLSCCSNEDCLALPESEADRARARVFCASMADVFERRDDLEAPRDRLMNLVGETKNLDWLILTKRPDFLVEYLDGAAGIGLENIRETGCFEHVIWGTSAEDQKRFDERAPEMAKLGMPWFLSAEPLLGPIELLRDGTLPSWVIVGGESGNSPRPMNPDWVRALRDSCAMWEVPFFFKQWGGRNKKAAGNTLDDRKHLEFYQGAR